MVAVTPPAGTPSTFSHAEWNYEGNTGPSFWGDLHQDFHACSFGSLQSPVDLNNNAHRNIRKVNVGKELLFDYCDELVDAELENWGFTLAVVPSWMPKIPEFSVSSTNSIDGLPYSRLPLPFHISHLSNDCPTRPSTIFHIPTNTTYTLVQFHIHSPSEHRVDGRALAAEVHFVHKDLAKEDGSGKVLVVSLPMKLRADLCEARERKDHRHRRADSWQQDTNTFLSFLLDTEIPYPHANGTAIPSLPLPSLFASRLSWRKYYSYSGSLTTPPCTEGVTWYAPVKMDQGITPKELQVLETTMPFNARFVMDGPLKKP